MKQIVIISGKGGTGKTSITASFAYLEKNEMVLADCDVDASDMHLLMGPDIKETEDFFSSDLAVLDQNKCIKCGKCMEICRFDAVEISEKGYNIIPLECEGCGYCTHICPSDALKLEKQKDGRLFFSFTEYEQPFFHAELGAGAENSGKLVTEVKQKAVKYASENNIGKILVDGSPGIGCPVIASLAGADFVLIVTEPTVSGVHDLKRVAELVKKFRIKCGCMINKYDINTDNTSKIRKFLHEENIDLISEIPYSNSFTESMTAAVTVAEYNRRLGSILHASWLKINKLTGV